jgi:hypothetical protein
MTLRLRRDEPLSPDGVRDDRIDALTAVLTPLAPITVGRLDGVRHAVDCALDEGVAFMVVDLRRTRDEVPGLDGAFRDAARVLAHRQGGLALVGGPGGLPDSPATDRFATCAEAVAGVRGRLTPAHSIETGPVPRPPARPRSLRSMAA